MFENVSKGWKLGSAVRKLAFDDQNLATYPIIAGILILIETVVILFPFFALTPNTANLPTMIFLLLIYYLVAYFTSIFILVAMLISFKSFENNKNMVVYDAFKQASKYLLIILEWAVFEAVITVITIFIEALLGRLVGKVSASLFGFATSLSMSVLTLFSIPIIIDKRFGPISAINESISFITKNFGKTFGGILFTEMYSYMFFLSGLVLSILGIVLAIVAHSFIAGAILIAPGVVLFAIGLMLEYVLNHIYALILYEWVNGGSLPRGITKELIYDALKKNKSEQNPSNKGTGKYVCLRCNFSCATDKQMTSHINNMHNSSGYEMYQKID